MESSCQIHGKFMESSWKVHGKVMEIYGSSWNSWKRVQGKFMETNGNLQILPAISCKVSASFLVPPQRIVPSWVGTDTDYVGHQPRRARVSIADITRSPVGAPSKIIALGNEIQSFLGSAWVRLRPQLMARRTEIKAWYWFTYPPHDNSRRRSQ